ncbi:MarR family transcriptional regulator [Sulfurimonas lithotrophica]|uniref:HTH-type transcriptional regulator SarZ n=1 Tax=Sulfurimonas lithotrophica TaxID=2590022 RepID=A0A5P8NZ10_9BACT|nr:MarR family transcriptional regulator [Sulfurimonas lithotrophica]QFR48672.1 MarR family transcriptional regulator [Sulfurimonas lithotrophica]
MNANELKLHLDSKDDDHICSKSDIGYVTLPLIMLSQKLLTKIENLLSKKYNLSNSEIDVLASLYSCKDEKHTLTPTKLYEKLLFSSGGMTKVLKKLELKEFIKRLDNIEDKRSKLVQLTPLGKNIVEKSLSEVIELEENFFIHLNEKDRKRLSDSLFHALGDHDRE